jgi:hypothetical protein
LAIFVAMRAFKGDPKKDDVVKRMLASGNWKLGPTGELLRVSAEEANQADLQRSREAANPAKYSPTTAGFMTPERKEYLENLNRPLTPMEAREYGTVSFDPSEGPNVVFGLAAGSTPVEPVGALVSQGLKRAGNTFQALRKGTPFKSEIDWGKWNPETPKYPELIKEYNDIERRTKLSGTWMKNADGTDFEGTPEQFIQQRSSYYRKAFPDGGTRVYRGVGPNDWKQGPEAPRWDTGGYDPEKAVPANQPVFLSEDLEQARSYQGDDVAYDSPFLDSRTYRDPRGGTFDLQAPSGSRDIASDQSGRSFKNLGTVPGVGPFSSRGIRNLSSERELLRFYNDYNTWAKQNNRNQITKFDRSKAIDELPLFKDIEKEQAFIKSMPNAASTDDVADFLSSPQGKKYSSFTARDIDDNSMGDVRIHRNEPGNYLKSNVGNVGFFDLSDPDVFKALAPIVGTSAAIKLAKSQGVENPGKKMSQGGMISMKKKPTGMSAIRK